jgi:sugar-phosphatase
LITAEDITNGKPAPDGFLLGAQRLAAAPQRAAVFEDSTAGILAGLAAGARVIATTSTLSAEQIDALNPLGYLHDYRGVSVQVDEDGVRLTVD